MARFSTIPEGENKPLIAAPVKPPFPGAYPWLKMYLKHTWNGCKQSCRDMKWLYSGKNHESETYAKRLKVQRLRSDAIKLVPFSVFVVVPFAELAIPPYLLLYQDAIPTQFHTTRKIQKDFYTSALRAESSIKELKKLLPAVLPPSPSLKSDEAEILSLVSNWLKHGIENADLENVKKVMPVFKTHIWPRILKDNQLLRHFVYAMGKGPLTGLFYLKFGLNLGSKSIKFIASPYLRLRVNRGLKLIASNDKLLDPTALSTLNERDLVQTAITRGIPIINKTRAELENDIKEWAELSQQGFLANFLLFLEICSRQT
jgi:LETM1 and EF-hand domain-containing protein 1